MSVILRSFLGVFLLSITPQEAFCHLSLKSIYDKEENPPPLANLLNLSPHTVIPKKEINYSSKFWSFEFLYECALDGESFYLEELQKQASVKDNAAVFPSLLLKCYYDKKKIAPDDAYQTNLNILLKEKKLELDKYIKVEDPYLNSSLAIYHREHGNISIAEQFAEQAIQQGSSEGYNILGSLYVLQGKLNNALDCYINAAREKNARGIYNVARLSPSSGVKSASIILNLYKQAAMHGSEKAIYEIGRYYEKKGKQQKAYFYFTYLARQNPELYGYLEKKKGFGDVSFLVIKELLKEDSPWCAYLLKAVYSIKNSKRKKDAAHYIAKGYDLGLYGLDRDLEKAMKWFNISINLGNTEDQHYLYTLSYLQGDHKTTLDKFIALGRQLSRQDTNRKIGKISQFLLVRVLVEEASDKNNKDYFQEAAYWLLDALESTNIESLEKKLWYVPGDPGKLGEFHEVEDFYLETIKYAPSNEVKSKAYYELAFHYLRGGYEQSDVFEKSLECFLTSYQLTLCPASYFYVVMLNDYFLTRDLSSLITPATTASSILYDWLRQDPTQKNPNQLKSLSLQSHPKPMDLTMSFFYHYGLGGVSPSLDHEIYYLKQAAQDPNSVASKITKVRYPLLMPLTEDEEKKLYQHRTHTQGLPNITIIGGGISGTLTALLLAQAAQKGKLSLGRIYLLEKDKHLLNGASKCSARLHVGGEYPKDLKTASECLVGAVLFKQMLQTKRVLTSRHYNNFLLARRSAGDSQQEDCITEQDMLAHVECLNKKYKGYLEQLQKEGDYDQQKAGEILFGCEPLSHLLEGTAWDKLGLQDHFIRGIQVKERGLNPSGLGVLLEYLLKQHPNIQVICDCPVSQITPLQDGGFLIQSAPQQEIYTRYLINAAWDRNMHLESLITKDATQIANHTVSLRSLLLVDIKDCFAKTTEEGKQTPSLPCDSSLFGLLGQNGGMVSCFNNSLAAVFIPKDGLSYQGSYVLSSRSDFPNQLPAECIDKHQDLEKEPQEVSNQILKDAQNKYPQLQQAKPVGLITRTILSQNSDAYKRFHINASWIGKNKDCLQICATKLTFAPFVALQAVASLAFESKNCINHNFNNQEEQFLRQFTPSRLFQDEDTTLEHVYLPEIFQLAQDDSFLTEEGFLAHQYHYAFQRQLPFTLFDENKEAQAAGINPVKQVELLLQHNKLLTEINLESTVLDLEMIALLKGFLQKKSHNLYVVRLGPLHEDFNDDENDQQAGQILDHLSKSPSLGELTIRGWNLTFSSRYTYLGGLSSKLKKLNFKGDTTLTSAGIGKMLDKNLSLSVTHFSFIQGNLDKVASAKLLKSLPYLLQLEQLNLSSNNMGLKLSNAPAILGEMILRTLSLKNLNISGNNLFVPENQVEDQAINQAVSNPLFLAIIKHSNLRQVDLSHNSPVATEMQKRLEWYFLLKT